MRRAWMLRIDRTYADIAADAATGDIERRITDILAEYDGCPLNTMRGNVVAYSACELECGYILTVGDAKGQGYSSSGHAPTVSSLVRALLAARITSERAWFDADRFNGALAEYVLWEQSTQ